MITIFPPNFNELRYKRFYSQNYFQAIQAQYQKDLSIWIKTLPSYKQPINNRAIATEWSSELNINNQNLK